MQCSTVYHSPAGTIRITEEDGFVILLAFSDNMPEPALSPTPVLLQCMDWLDQYFAGMSPAAAAVPLRLSGTAFQRQVWEHLRQLPYGTAVSYGEIAKRISPFMSAQAVGRAVGKNPVSILIPCHRVLGTQGQLTGYAFGLARKRFLLDLEHIPYKQ